MNFDDWEPVYVAILRDFGFDRAADERVRDRLVELVSGRSVLRPRELSFEGETVAIAGAGPSLPDDIDVAAAADSVVAASTAVDVLQDAGLDVDCMVTDLDKNPAMVQELTERAVPVAVHAHGDNGPAVEEWVPRLDLAAVLPTTQAAPVGPVVNLGGFTDGDRAAFMAHHLGAAELVFPGWDFDDESVDAMKAKKLDWAERLLYWLERRRGERFGVLDGRRVGIDVSSLPVE